MNIYNIHFTFSKRIVLVNNTNTGNSTNTPTTNLCNDPFPHRRHFYSNQSSSENVANCKRKVVKSSEIQYDQGTIFMIKKLYTLAMLILNMFRIMANKKRDKVVSRVG